MSARDNDGLTRIIAAHLDHDGHLDGSAPGVEWRMEGDGGCWGYHLSRLYVDLTSDDGVSAEKIEEDGFETALACYMALRCHLDETP